MSFDVQHIRADFPVLAEIINGQPLVYLDSANTSQKPNAVINAMTTFMQHAYGPTNRSAYKLASDATDAFEGARAKVAAFINAPAVHEVVFTKNATESLNLIVRTWGTQNLNKGDVVVLTHMEHHANIVPWQMLAAEKGFTIRWVPLTEDGLLDLSDLDTLLTGAKAFSFTSMSNVLGTINPVKELCARAHKHGAIAIVDGCQSVPHMPIDVKKLNVDFLAFSGHKALGPTGVGVLWSSVFEELPPFLFGGSMIETVTMTSATWAPAPRKFEAGVPNMAQAVGLGAALDYLTEVGMQSIFDHEIELTGYLINGLLQIPELSIVGPQNTDARGGSVSFTVGHIHPHDLGQYLDSQGVAVRTGHHCAWPLTRKLGVPATTRASLYLYNDESDCDALFAAITGAQKYFA